MDLVLQICPFPWRWRRVLVCVELSPPVLHFVWYLARFSLWSGVPSFRGVRAWCLVLGTGCASAQGRRRWYIVGAYTWMLAGRVARVSLWVCVCVLRGSSSSVVYGRVNCASDDSLCLLVRFTFKPMLLLFPFRKWLWAFGAASMAISSFHQRGVALKRKKTEIGSLVSGQGVGWNLSLSQIVPSSTGWLD